MEPAAEQVLLANAVDSSQMQQKIHNPWNGSCFGLSTVSVLVRDGVLPLSLLDPEAETLHDVRMTAQAESIFNYYQNTQYAKQYLTHSGNTKIGTQYGVLCLAAQYAADFNSSGRPFVVTFLTARGTLHAVVGNGLETGDWTLNDRSYDRRIRIWDSNYSGMNDNCCIYFNHLTLDYLIPQYSIGPHARGDSYAGALSSTECDAALLNEYPYPEEAVSGDLNGDRKRNTADAVLLARYVAEDPVPLTVFPVLSAADLNTDGVIDLRDVFALLRML